MALRRDMAFGLPGDYDLSADAAATPEDRARVKKLLGQLNDTVQAGGPTTQRLQRRGPDGTVYSVQVSPAGRKAYIEKHPATAETPNPTLESMWVPRGFVLYPAWADAPFGVGLPVVADGADMQAPQNLAPGIDRNRWTAAGACGEVLLSPDPGAGYPDASRAPVSLLYSTSYGPQPDPGAKAPDAAAAGAWNAYRLELAPFVARGAQSNPVQQRAYLAAVNAARAGQGLVPCVQRFRGYADVAELAAGVFQAAGSLADASPAYPVDYRTSAARIYKDGFSCDWTQFTVPVVNGAPLPVFERGVVLFGQELRALGASAAQAVAEWRQVSGNLIDGSQGACTTADVGFTDGYAVVTLTARDRWIQAGNMSWQGADANLPPISWHGFATLELAFETLPVQPHMSAATPFTLVAPMTDANGDFWFTYPRARDSDPAHNEPAMGRHIYCRGRSLALAPRGGLIWGACVQTWSRNGTKVDRLIALVHHPEDQSADWMHEGFTRYLRVWWADVPARSNGLRLSPVEVICGTDADDPWGWRGGTLVDVGAMPAGSGWVASTEPNALKYTSQWQFAPDGTRAVCLRDYAAAADYYTNVWNAGSLGSGEWVYVAPRAVRLSLALTEAGTGVPDLDVTTTFSDNSPTIREVPLQPIPSANPPLTNDGAWLAPVAPSASFYETPLDPIAVGYDADGTEKWIWGGSVIVGVGTYNDDNATAIIQMTTVGPGGDVQAKQIGRVQMLYEYMGAGSAGAEHFSDLERPVLVGASLRTPSVPFRKEMGHVLSVADEVYAAEVIRPRWIGHVRPEAPPNENRTVLFADADVEAPCPSFTTAGVFGVVLARAGVALPVAWYANPDGVQFTLKTLCTTQAAQGTTIPVFGVRLAASRMLQGFSVRRFDSYAYGYQVAPVPGTIGVLTALPADTDCGCWPTDNGGAGVTFDPFALAHAAPRGGHIESSVALPDMGWSVFGKVV